MLRNKTGRQDALSASPPTLIFQILNSYSTMSYSTMSYSGVKMDGANF